MSDLDTAHLNLFVALRSGSGDDAASVRPVAGVLVYLDPGPQLRGRFIRYCLARGWERVPPPVGHVDPASPEPLAHVTCDGEQGLTVIDRNYDEVLYTSTEAITTTLPAGWYELAVELGHALVYLAVSSTPLVTSTQINDAARAGHVTAGWATITCEPTWATAYRPVVPGPAPTS